ncbi:response regulator transcription factor [Prescottella agglutinans]|uniref:DNA-binding NarL/FixJ family response regulator n=1 Tax=Prescottella agglutinans TaxID=1644129 RepID=A0ABT6MDA9_9NOCA|nr:response regulator transcription factor [Prescottella agglutinans]MDH6282303.1 DNA-binding NarL/FixJ family response regulator [Prescottella agglutinans]
MSESAWVRRALVVEDQPLMRSLVAEALRHAGFEVHDRPSAALALADFDEIDPDVLVTDIDLGTRPNGMELATIVHAQAPHCAVVFLTNYPRAGIARGDGVPAGSVFLDKVALESVEDLVAAVESALVEKPVPPGPARDDSPDAVLERLTRTQLDVLRCIALGWSNAEIARRRGSSLRSVEKMVTRVFDALGVGHSPELNPRVAAAQLYVRRFGMPAEID